MGFLKKLFSGGGAKKWKDETSEAIFIYSECAKCGEKFQNRIDKTYDLIVNYEDSGSPYRAHKELIGSQCHNKLIVDLEFDQGKRLIAKEIQKGKFITREEFEGLETEGQEN